MPEAKDSIPATPMAPLMVQFLYDGAPTIDFARLTAKVEEYCGRTDEGNRAAPDSKMAHYFMLDALVQFKEGRLPSQLCLCCAEMRVDANRVETALQQTWDWAEARQVVASAS